MKEAGVMTVLSYNYRHTLGLQMVKHPFDEGRIGTILTFRGDYLQD